MLSAAVMLEELQRFADPSASVFAGWPTSRVAGRRRWAVAFAAYVDDAVDVTPVLSPNGVTLDFSAVEEQFFATVTLDNPSIDAAALDLATAWRAAIGALLPGSSATDASSTSFTFATMDPTDVDTRFAQLRTALVAAFETGSSTRRADLQQIADAFHAATEGLHSTLTPFAVSYG